jgi:hypothetical protein
MKRTHVVVLLALLVSLRAMCADAVRLAILAGEGERAPKTGMVDLLMVELSQRPEVVVLEREAIGKILAEQKLSLSGLADRTQAVRTGLLLSADLLLAVERIGQEQERNRQYRVKVIEAQSGLTVGDSFFDGPAVEQKPEIMATDTDRCLAWLRMPAGRRRYVAVLGYSAEQRGESLTDLPVALAALVESRIAESTNVLVVDRAYLQHLKGEQELTGIERQLALSSYLVEGLIRPVATNAAAIEVQTRIQSLQGTAEEPVLQALGSVSNVLVLAHDAAGAILRRIGADPLSSAPLPPAREAARLVGHAQMLERYGETARALPLLESAYVLDPRPGTALQLAGALKAAAVGRAGTTNALPEAEKQALLISLLRVMRLCQVELDQRIADSRGKTVSFMSVVHAPAHVLGETWVRLRSEDPETSRLYRELREQKDACRRREVEYVRKLWPRFRYGPNKIPGSTKYYHDLVWHEIQEIANLSADTSEYVAQLKLLMAPWLEMPGYTSPYVLGMLMSQVGFSLSVHLHSGADLREMLAWCDWVADQPSPLFAFAARYFKTQLFMACHRAEIKVSDCSWYTAAYREMVDLYPALLTRYGYDYFINRMMDDVMVFSKRIDPAEQIVVWRKQLDAVVTCLDRRSFVQWVNANWGTPSGTAMRKLNSRGEDDQRRWLEVALARLPPPHLAQYRTQIVQAGIDAARNGIERSLLQLLSQEGSVPPPEISLHWKAYEVVPAAMGTPPRQGEQLRLCKRVGDCLVLVWSTAQGDAHPSFLAEVCSLDGKPIRSFPPFIQNASAASNAPVDLRDVTLDDERLFVAAGAAGLLVFSRSDVRLYGVSEGVPRAPLAAVAAIGGKVVMGFDTDYLGAFDPRSRKFEEIAYSRSLLKRNPLDGCQQRFCVRALAADPGRACVWLTTRQPDGVWRLALPDNGLEPVGGNQFFESLNVDNGTLLGTWYGGLVRYESAAARWVPVPLYGLPGPYLEPRHVLLGPDIISAGRAGGGAAVSGGNSFVFRGQKGLYLHKRVARDAFHLPLEAGGKPAHIGFLIKTSDRTALAGTIEGAFWRLTRPEGAAPEEEAVDKEQQVLDAFIAAQTNRVAARALAASSTADAAFAATNLCDGLDGTCWAAATNDVRGAWVEIELERPAWLSSLRLVNGWVPDEKQRTHYPVNHRVQRLDVTTDTGEKALFDVEDHNDPQYLRPVFRKPVRRLRFTVVEIHESEVVDFEDPPWLNLSEITFFESREGMR